MLRDFGSETIGTDAGQLSPEPPYPCITTCTARPLRPPVPGELGPPAADGRVIFCAPLKIKNGSGGPIRALRSCPLEATAAASASIQVLASAFDPSAYWTFPLA